jgi:hypothetical protein
MKRAFYLFSVLLLVFSSCKKDDPVNDRDKFIGEYVGTQTVTFTFDNVIQSTNTEAGTESITAGIMDNQVIIGADGEIQLKATVSGSTLTINSQIVQVDNGDGTYTASTATGSGVLLSTGALTLTYQIVGVYQGFSFKYEYVESVSK